MHPACCSTFTSPPNPDVFANGRDWIMSAFGLTEDQALTLITVACDFQVHQVRERERTL